MKNALNQHRKQSLKDLLFPLALPCLMAIVLAVLTISMASCQKEPSQQDNPQDTTNSSGDLLGDNLFSVSDYQKVEFAPGNLKEGGHGFEKNQYDFGGRFGWGTGNRPTITSTDYSDYPSFFDWGNYNTGGLWRTLSREEWEYLFFGRPDAYQKYGMGTVNNVRGLILLPDQWAQPADCSFKWGYGWWKNDYDKEQWTKMEESGVVFLPTAGVRWENVVSREGAAGLYWTETEIPEIIGPPRIPPTKAYCAAFSETSIGVDEQNRCTGCSVRLVKNRN